MLMSGVSLVKGWKCLCLGEKMNIKLAVLSALSIAIAFPLNANAQRRLPPAERLVSDVKQLSPGMMKLFPKIALQGELNQMIVADGWRIIRTKKMIAVGIHDQAGIIAAYNADVDGNPKTKDDSFVIHQLSEMLCPADIAENPRLKGEKPSLDITTTMLIQGKKTTLNEQVNVIAFKVGSPIDRLACRKN